MAVTLKKINLDMDTKRKERKEKKKTARRLPCPSSGPNTWPSNGRAARLAPRACRPRQRGRRQTRISSTHSQCQVHEWRAAVKASSIHTVRVVDRAAAKALEGRRGGVRVGAPTHPFGQTLVGRQGGGGGAGVPADYEGRVYRSGEGPLGG